VTGDHLKEVPVPYAIRVSRVKLRKLLHEGIEIQYGKALETVEYGEEGKVKASFADGSSFKGDLLAGADGHRSKTREVLFGKEQAAPKPVSDGYQLGRISICYNDAEKAKHVSKSYILLILQLFNLPNNS
jgi:2-polyprenyl-6-methoxyphenol hydroxylase-like FAD-dependent oxidoreductase